MNEVLQAKERLRVDLELLLKKDDLSEAQQLIYDLQTGPYGTRWYDWLCAVAPWHDDELIRRLRSLDM